MAPRRCRSAPRCRQPNGPERPRALGSTFSSGTNTLSSTISPVTDARRENLPSIFGVDAAASLERTRRRFGDDLAHALGFELASGSLGPSDAHVGVLAFVNAHASGTFAAPGAGSRQTVLSLRDGDSSLELTDSRGAGEQEARRHAVGARHAFEPCHERPIANQRCKRHRCFVPRSGGTSRGEVDSVVIFFAEASSCPRGLARELRGRLACYRWR